MQLREVAGILDWSLGYEVVTTALIAEGGGTPETSDVGQRALALSKVQAAGRG